MTLNQLVAALTIVGMLLGAGIWLGRIQASVDRMERQQQYLHGTIELPKGN